MKLNGTQLQQILNALISAYPNISALERMVRFGLNENLQSIAGGSSLTDVVFQLISWAQAQGRLEELVREAYQQNPGNRDLQVVAGWFVSAPTPAPTVGSAPTAGATPMPDRVAIRNALPTGSVPRNCAPCASMSASTTRICRARPSRPRLRNW